MKAAALIHPRYLGAQRRLAPAIVLTTLIAGCADPTLERTPTFRVSGTLTHQGRPMSGAFVTLHPVSPVTDFPTPRGSVGADGSLRVSTYTANDGAPAGDYLITVEWYKPQNNNGELVPGPNVIPRRFASPKTSQLGVHVAERETVIPPISL